MANQALAVAPKSHKASYMPGLETRRKRRAAVLNVIDRLQNIQYSEEVFMYNTPEYLRDAEAYVSAKENVSYLQDAIVALMYAY